MTLRVVVIHHSLNSETAACAFVVTTAVAIQLMLSNPKSITTKDDTYSGRLPSRTNIDGCVGAPSAMLLLIPIVSDLFSRPPSPSTTSIHKKLRKTRFSALAIIYS